MMVLPIRFLAVACLALSFGCTQQESAPSEPPAPPVINAEPIASDPGWGNTEGPTVDSNGVLYFTSRGSFKGIVSWSEAEGAKQHLAVAEMEGPGGLWIDADDNIYLTATGERKILKVSPSLEVSVVAENFEAAPDVSQGPNDIVVGSDGVIFFTAPNGYDSLAPNGTVYRIGPEGETAVFSSDVSGPNGVVLSRDEKTLYVSHNIDAVDQTTIVSYPILPDGSAGERQQVAVVSPCRADGMTVNRDGDIWLTCYSFGMAYLFTPEGEIVERVSVEQKALTNIVFGRNGDENIVYLSSSDMDRQTGYVYRARVSTPGLR